MTHPFVILCRPGKRVPACIACGAFPKYREPGVGLYCDPCWQAKDARVRASALAKSPGGSRDDLYPES